MREEGETMEGAVEHLFSRLRVVALVAMVSAMATSAIGQTCTPPHPAVVRISNATRTATYHGSGTLIEADTVLTCAHVLDHTGRITVRFASGATATAELLGQDPTWDLGLLRIAPQATQPITISQSWARPGEGIQSHGWGTGCYGSFRGRALGYASPGSLNDHELLEAAGTARDGDSGGPILNQAGELVAVTTGRVGTNIIGPCCVRIRKFLDRFRSRPPLVPIQPPPNRPVPPTPPVDVDGLRQGLLADLRAELQRQLEGLSIGMCPGEPPPTPPEPALPIPSTPTPPAPLPRVAGSLLSGLMPAMLAAFGISSPAALIGVLLARRVARRLINGIGPIGPIGPAEPVVIREDAKPSSPIVRRDRTFVEIEKPDQRLKALQLAMDEYVRRHPGARGIIETIEQFANQYESGFKEKP